MRSIQRKKEKGKRNKKEKEKMKKKEEHAKHGKKERGFAVTINLPAPPRALGTPDDSKQVAPSGK